MKKILITALLSAFLLPLSAQQFRKGNVYTHHVVRVKLKPGVSPAEFTRFMKEEFLPAWEMYYEGIETVFLQGIRGEHESEYGWINYYDSMEELRSFYPEPGKSSLRAKEAARQMKAYEKKLARFGSMKYTGYTTWVVQ